MRSQVLQGGVRTEGGALGVKRPPVEGRTYEKKSGMITNSISWNEMFCPCSAMGEKEYKREGYEWEMWYPNLRHMFVPRIES